MSIRESEAEVDGEAEAKARFSAPGTRCPADLSPLPEARRTEPAELEGVVRRARDAQREWSRVAQSRREAAALGLGRRLLERRAALAQTLSRETGRAPLECVMSELVGSAEYARAAVRASHRALGVERIALSRLDYPGKRARIEPVARGVIGVIAPWNYPLLNFLKALYPALLSGNAVVLKPSEHAPRSGVALGEVCAEVLPKDLVQVVTGDGQLGGALIEAGIDGLVFTGSVATGRQVAARAGARLIPCSLELGGHDAALVLSDCALERTVAGVLAWAFHNAGQNCAAIARVLVEDAVAEPFLERLVRAATRLKVAPDGGDLGPVQNARQLAVVERHVADALEKGAVLRCGGVRTGKGWGYAPTILDRCASGMKVVDEETFGPVLAVTRVPDVEAAVRIANESRLGLSGSVWTTDLARGEALARRLEVGMCLVNNHAIPGVLAELPWTGTKETGPGVAASHHAYGTFVRRRLVFVDGSRAPDPWWFPQDEDLERFAEAAAARQLGRLSAMLELAGLLKRRARSVLELVR